MSATAQELPLPSFSHMRGSSKYCAKLHSPARACHILKGYSAWANMQACQSILLGSVQALYGHLT